MTEPEQWAVELVRSVKREVFHLQTKRLGRRDLGVDLPTDEVAAALTIQRAFDERERKLRAEMAVVQQSHDWMYGEKQRLENALKDIASRAHANLATRQDAPKACEDTSHDH